MFQKRFLLVSKAISFYSFRKAEVKKLKAQCAQFFGHISKKSGLDFCCLFNWVSLVQRAAAMSSTDGELDDAMKVPTCSDWHAVLFVLMR
jgi:hypothetical protein